MSIYLDNAATSVRKPESVINAIRNTIENYGNPARGVYTESLNSSRLIYEARENIAKFVGCPEVSHVIFTTTKDLNAEFPAKFARINFGWTNIAMMCFHELDVPNSLAKCLRVLIVINCEKTFQPKFVYLKEAKSVKVSVRG